MNNKGQIDYPLITFIVIVIGLIILAPFMLKIVNEVLTPFSAGVGNVTAEAGTSVTHIRDTFINFWDFVIIAGFLFAILLLFISSFLVETHPFFLIIFILLSFFTFLFAPSFLDVLDTIYNSSQFATEVSTLAMIDFIRTYLGIILVGIYFVCGVIMFARFRFGGGNP